MTRKSFVSSFIAVIAALTASCNLRTGGTPSPPEMTPEMKLAWEAHQRDHQRAPLFGYEVAHGGDCCFAAGWVAGAEKRA